MKDMRFYQDKKKQINNKEYKIRNKQKQKKQCLNNNGNLRKINGKIKRDKRFK